jgi:long-chain acyl-CoA synthetase
MSGDWVFDLDGTLVDSHTGTSLRPGAIELLDRLRTDGCRVLLWSAGGAEYARRRAVQHDIVTRFDGFFDKLERDAEGRYIPTFLADPARATFVDDRPDDMPSVATVVAVSPYLAPDPHDAGLARALAARQPVQ